MTDEEIIEMAKQAGFVWVSQWQIPTCENKHIKAFARLVAAKQKERDAAFVAQCDRGGVEFACCPSIAAAILAEED